MQTLRFCFSILLIFFSSSFCNGQSSVRKKINIDDEWRFHFGNAANPGKDFNYSVQLIAAGVAGVKAVDPSIIIMLHVALGGQNDESVFFIDNMIARGIHFDVIGESYYPKWHGTLDDLRYNLNDLVRRYNKDVIVVEYSALKNEVNKIAFELPGGKGKGTCIWEPLSMWESVFDKDGKSNDFMKIYDEISKKYVINK